MRFISNVFAFSARNHDHNWKALQWTVTAPDIAPYVDILMTTNDMGKSKIDGYFLAVLQKFQIKPDDMIFIGDSATRDVAPARMEGI